MDSSSDRSPAFRKLWASLRGNGHLWHATSLSSLEKILGDGAIVPNGGNFPEMFPQSKVSYSRHLSAVSLFDFDTSDEAYIFTEEFKWGPVLFNATLPDVGVLIRIGRALLITEKLILPNQISESDPRLAVLPDEIRKMHMLLPGVEAMHIGPVPVAAITGFILIAGENWWQEMPRDDQSYERLSRLAAAWVSEYERDKAERHARGEYTLAELLEAAHRKH